LDAAGSAILRAYLGSLGLSESAIFFMTMKGKDEGNFLAEETPLRISAATATALDRVLAAACLLPPLALITASGLTVSAAPRVVDRWSCC
jgi:hypothetical protein